MKTMSFACALLLMVSLTASAESPAKTVGSIERFDPALDALLGVEAKIEVLSQGHDWIEGPVWVKEQNYLLFSEIPKNQILKWAPGAAVSVFMEPSGYTGSKPFTGSEPGTNGLVIDKNGRLVMCCHGDRMVRRVEKNGVRKVLIDKFQGKRFNSPNDLVYHDNGDLFFTDPPYGLPKRFNDPEREMGWCGVYRLSSTGDLSLITKEIAAPNGIGLSPDGRTLYVAQSKPDAAIWTAFDVAADGVVSKGRVFYDATEEAGKIKGLPDGMAIDMAGNLWASGPGGILILSPEGDLLGRILTGQATSNATFGEDGSSLFITADMFLLRVKTKTRGSGF
jgi:gluconolactonase